MCHVSMYNQILSSAAGPCGKLAKLALMRSLNNSNKDALSGNAGHGDADGITQPNKDARCTGTEDFFQSSSNFKSADAATLTEARALTALRAAREENTRKRAAVSQGVHCMHFPRITTQQSRTPPPPPDRPTDRSIGRSIVRSSIRRPRRVPSTARDAPPPRGRRSSMYTLKIHRVSSLPRLARPIIARATNASSSPGSPRSRISVAYRSRVPPRSSVGRSSVVVVVASRPPLSVDRFRTHERHRHRIERPRTSRRERRARRGRRARESLRSESHHHRVTRRVVRVGRGGSRRADRGGCDK